MKKYYLVTIYQVSPRVGYLKSGEPFSRITVLGCPDNEYKLEAAITITNINKIIMVEKIFPNHVREVKTGIVFPIVNFQSKDQYDKELIHISCTCGKVHTFVYSENDKLLSLEITTSEELERYNKMYPDAKKLKEELQTIIDTGQANMESRIAKEIYARQLECKNIRTEDSAKRDEKRRIKKIKQQFKQSRKKIK